MISQKQQLIVGAYVLLNDANKYVTGEQVEAIMARVNSARLLLDHAIVLKEPKDATQERQVQESSKL